MKFSYLDWPHGQIHIREWGYDSDTSQPPLVCLHPAPYSGAYFETMAPLLAKNRHVIALDYPGYGGSTRLKTIPTIGDYAKATRATIKHLGLGSEAVDLLGFHTGCLVAVEASLQTEINRLFLIDVPFFSQEEAEKKLKLFGDKNLSPDFSDLEPTWQFNVTKRHGDIGLSRSFNLFVEQLRAGEHSNDAFQAAFSYPCESSFAKAAAAAYVLATQSTLLDPSRKAAATLPNGTLIECLDVTKAALELGAESLAKTLSEFDADPS